MDRRNETLDAMSTRSLAPAAAAIVALFAAGAARADQAACTHAYERGQQLRLAGKLSAAADELATCVAECPGVFAKDCRTWQGEVAAEMPRITFRVTGRDGCELKTVRLRVDDSTATLQPGAATALDPGKHRLTVTPLAGPSHEELFTAAASEERVVSVVVDVAACAAPPPAAREPKTESRPVPTLTYVLGGIGVAGLAAGGIFGGWGLAQKGDLDRTCKPSCPGADVDAMYRTFLVADISAAVGLVGLAGAAVAFLLRPTVEASGRASATRGALAP